MHPTDGRVNNKHAVFFIPNSEFSNAKKLHLRRSVEPFLPSLFNNLQPSSFSKARTEWLMADLVGKSSRAVSAKLPVRAEVQRRLPGVNRAGFASCEFHSLCM
jgi:hypothetical protein